MARILTFVTLPLRRAASAPGPTASAQPRQPSSPHPEEAAILALVDRFMLAVGDEDPGALTSSASRADLRSERPAPSGGTLVTRRVFTQAAGTRAADYRERYWDLIVLVRGSLAVVWTPYEFWVDGKTSHCGIDVFDLLKEQGVWNIAKATSTVEPEACRALRPAGVRRAYTGRARMIARRPAASDSAVRRPAWV